jgi:branched-chain amino acid transport system substrate-binding protein
MSRALLAALVVLLAVLPWFVPAYLAFQLTFVAAYAIAILGLIILTGYNGQISLGHGAFMAVGGYAVASMLHLGGIPYWVSVPSAAIACSVFGVAIGFVALRLAGVYLALATLALAVSVPPMLKRFKALTGGVQGISLPSPHAPAALGWMSGEAFYYYVTWALAAVLFGVAWFVLRGRVGRCLRAIRDSEIAAVAFGVNPVFYKTLAFGWSAAYAGVAGALLAVVTAYVSPDVYGFSLSLTLVIGLVLGGLGSMWGALIGGVIIEFLPLWAQKINPAASSIVYGVALIVVMVFMPGGIAGALEKGLRAFRGSPSQSKGEEMRTTRSVAVLLLFAFVAAASLPASAQAVPGVSNTEILLGGVHPYSGPASAYSSIGKGAQAYFAYINDKGGVFGRKITYKDLDDGYNPPQSLQLTKQLVEQDHVFAMFNPLGTPVNTVLRPYLNEKGVPQLFVATGASTWGNDSAKFPWTIGWQPDYVSEATIYARYILQREPNAKIGALYQNDDYGLDYLNGLTKALGAKSSMIVKSVSYEVADTDVKSQIVNLKNSGADTVMIFATPKFSIQALVAISQLGWKPKVFLNSVSNSQTVMRPATEQGGPGATNGVISVIYLKDPSDPKWASDPGMQLYKQIMAKYAPSADTADQFYLYGMGAAFTLVDCLQRAGKNLTRDGIMKAALHIHETNNPFVLPGIIVQTSPDDRFPIRQEQLANYEGGRWTLFGNLLSARR